MRRSTIYVALGAALTIITATVLCVVLSMKKKRCCDDACDENGCSCEISKKAEIEADSDMAFGEKKNRKCCKTKA